MAWWSGRRGKSEGGAAGTDVRDAGGRGTDTRGADTRGADTAGTGARSAGAGGIDAPTVAAVNDLTALWMWAAAGKGEDKGTLVSALGVWPLLAFLAGAAQGPARDELAAALAVPAHTAIARGRTLIDVLEAEPGLSAALGVWAKKEVELRPEWVAQLPVATVGGLTGDHATDRAALDMWASVRTGGLIPEMPIELTPAVRLVLASALTVRTTWQRPFGARPTRSGRGPWAGRGDLAVLGRSSDDLDEVRVAGTADGPLTVFEVRGDNGIDVHLLLGGEELAPGAVVEAGVRTLAGRYDVVPGSRLPEGAPGPGLTVQETASRTSKDRLDASTVAFTVSADHDLIRRAGLFGLAAASKRDSGSHFPGVSDRQLVVQQARQAVTASFGAKGFEAAAVTAAALLRPTAVTNRRAKLLRADFDRPFGFLAVHRATGLVLAAGWVTEPQTMPEGSLSG